MHLFLLCILPRPFLVFGCRLSCSCSVYGADATYLLIPISLDPFFLAPDLAAPRISEEEEAEEKASFTDAERLEALSDLYGLLPIPKEELVVLDNPDVAKGHTKCSSLFPEESDEEIELYLHRLDEALNEICADADAANRNGEVDVTLGPCASSPPQSVRISTLAYREALEKCPEIALSRDHRLLFLRAEYHKATEAAIRMFRYWTDRTELFGANAFGNLLALSGDGVENSGEHYKWDGEITGPMQNDAVELGIGYPRLSPERDRSGRALLIFNQSVVERKNAYDRNGMRRALYYRIHLALRDIQVQRSGFVLIGLGYGQIDQLDRKLDVSLWRTIRDVLPARIVASHFVYGSNKHMYTLIAPNIKFFFGRNARARLKEYTGNESITLEKLSHFGIPASALPKEVGGDWIYDASWYKKALLQGMTVDQIKNL